MQQVTTKLATQTLKMKLSGTCQIHVLLIVTLNSHAIHGRFQLLQFGVATGVATSALGVGQEFRMTYCMTE